MNGFDASDVQSLDQNTSFHGKQKLERLIMWNDPKKVKQCC